MAGLTFDAGVLIAADRNDRRAWQALNDALSRGVTPVVPTPALVQAWRGPRNANLARFLGGCRIEVLDATLARRAGELCGRAGTADAVDATVVVSAAGRGDAVMTSDSDDINLLVAHAPGVAAVISL